MARDGLFADLDAVLEWHTDDRNAVNNYPEPGQQQLHGGVLRPAAHAAGDPWKGRSALDAVELMTHGANLMREHLPPTARVHYVIRSAGEAPNVVPAYAKVWFFVRDIERAAAESHYDWLLKIAEGAALATQTTHKVMLNTGVHEYLFNRPLQEALQANLREVGAAPFTEDEQAFARQIQKELGLPEAGIDVSVKHVEPKGWSRPRAGPRTWPRSAASRRRSGLYLASMGKDLPGHSWAASASHGLARRRQGGGPGREDPGHDRRGPAHEPAAARSGPGGLPGADRRKAVPVAAAGRTASASAVIRSPGPRGASSARGPSARGPTAPTRRSSGRRPSRRSTSPGASRGRAARDPSRRSPRTRAGGWRPRRRPLPPSTAEAPSRAVRPAARAARPGALGASGPARPSPRAAPGPPS